MSQIIKLSDNAANRIKKIMSGEESTSIGVRVAVKSGWLCRHVLCYGVR